MNRRIDIQDLPFMQCLRTPSNGNSLRMTVLSRNFTEMNPLASPGDRWKIIGFISEAWYKASCCLIWISGLTVNDPQYVTRSSAYSCRGTSTHSKAYSTKSFRRGEAGDVSIVTIQPLLATHCMSPTGQLRRSSSVPLPISNKKVRHVPLVSLKFYFK